MLTEAFERHETTAGTVWYRDEDHSYWMEVTKDGRGSGRLTSVSTIVKPFDFDPGRLLRWAARTTTDGVASLADDSLNEWPDIGALSWMRDGEALWEQLTEAKLLYSDASTKAAKRGTNVHKFALETLASGEPIDLDAMTDEERGYAEGVWAFWCEHKPKPIHSEKVVADLDLRVAGRFDLIYEDSKGEPVLLDCKTSKWIGPAMHAQLAGYKHCEPGPISRTELLQVKPDGSYELIEGRATENDFLNAVAVYRRAAEMKRKR